MRTPLITVAVIALMATNGVAQRHRKTVAQTQTTSGSSATSVSAELIEGKLNPAESKPGDEVTIKLKGDVKSTGDVVLKKGTVITGVVRNASRIEESKGHQPEVHSLIDVEWMAPGQDSGSRELMLAVQSVIQVNSLGDDPETGDWDVPAHANRGLGLVNAGINPTSSGGRQSNAALLNMPSVIRADAQTTSSLNTDLGMADSGQQLFQTGHGQILTSSGHKESINIFSHLNNDTVITSPSKNFEISSGAELRLLVGMHKK
jgi:hypothetical protein